MLLIQSWKNELWNMKIIFIPLFFAKSKRKSLTAKIDFKFLFPDAWLPRLMSVYLVYPFSLYSFFWHNKIDQIYSFFKVFSIKNNAFITVNNTFINLVMKMYEHFICSQDLYDSIVNKENIIHPIYNYY